MGPFPSSRGNTYILITVDYLSKWVEAKALPTNDARVVVKFLKYLFARFGTPRAIISDRGTHFYNDKFAKVMSKYGVTHRLAIAYHPQTSGQVELQLNELRDQAYENSLIYKERTKKLHDSKIKYRIFNVGDRVLLFNSRLQIFSVNGHCVKHYFGGDIPSKVPLNVPATAYHPQTSGQVEVSNRGLKRILERTVGENGASWFDRLDDALWAFSYWALKHVNFDLKTTGDHRKLQLKELNELRDQGYENSLIYKERTKKLHDSKIKNRIFNVGDRVLLYILWSKDILGKA
ncbi:reverse transcriptase domain-containing protein [Tanacetum coccineum]|uniref:Reverse transcriptase domain-containing protein n=1 Tax=Tanacetum coccineum TaxID=301880 RepID=A0ABQ5J5T4_9ASTR